MKLSETLHSLASHVGSLAGKGVGFAQTGVKLEQGALSLTMTFEKILTAMALGLESSPWTLPGLPIAPAPTTTATPGQQ
jgi:hypothetical protein